MNKTNNPGSSGTANIDVEANKSQLTIAGDTAPRFPSLPAWQRAIAFLNEEGSKPLGIQPHSALTAPERGKPCPRDLGAVQDPPGNGSVNSGETDWQNAADLGLKVLITRPKNGSIIA